MDSFCIGCSKVPEEVKEYVEIALETQSSASFVAEHEETFNKENGHFVCPRCYFKCGVPNPVDGWVAP